MTVRFSKAAASDLADVFAYSIKAWGVRQAGRYLAELEDACEALEEAGAGRLDAALGFWRCEHRSHVVFFRRRANGSVFVVRILHEHMLPALHLPAPKRLR